jgi:hypothetical protein
MTKRRDIKGAAIAALREAGPAGLGSEALARAMKISRSQVNSHLSKYAGVVRCADAEPTWVAAEHAAAHVPVMRAPLHQPTVKAMLGRGYESPVGRSRASFIKLKDQGQPAVVPPGVTVQRQGYVADSRYSVDPATFTGGELMAEWQRLRGGRSARGAR